MADYKPVGVPFDRTFRNTINENFGILDNAVNTQKTRVDDLIAGTEQPSEVVDARGGAPVLRDRLDGVDAQLAEKAPKEKTESIITPEEFGAKGDAVTDDTQAFKELASYLLTNNTEVHWKPTAKYVLTEPLYFKSGLRMYGHGAEIIWRGTPTFDNSSRSVGIFNVNGDVEQSNKYDVTAINLQGNLVNNESHTLPYYGSITVPNHPYQVGDYIVMELDTGTQNSLELKPRDHKLVKIVRVEGDILYVDYTSPYTLNISQMTSPKVYKATPAENIVLDNIFINDERVITEPKDWINSHPNVSEFMSGVVLRYCRNVTINKVKGYNTKFPVFYVMLCSHLRFQDGYLDKPAIVGPGEGYYTQFNNSRDIIVENIQGENTRHIVDFTASSNAIIKKSKGNKSYGIDFQSHGNYEHNIVYEDCIGTWNFASGESFGNAVRDYSLIRCKGMLLGKYSKNITIKDSEFTLNNPLTSLKAENSLIHWYLSSGTYEADPRSVKNDRVIHFKNCNVKVYSSTFASAIISYHDITIEGGQLIDLKKETENYRGGFLIDLRDVDKFTVINCSLVDNIRFRINTSSVDIDFAFDKNHMICHGEYYHFTAKTTSNMAIRAKITNNTFINGKTDGTRMQLHRLPSNDDQTNTQSIVLFKDNIVKQGTILAQVTSTKDVYISRDNTLIDCSVTVDSGISKIVNTDIIVPA